MKTSHRLMCNLLSGWMCILFAGCASVDPRRDYTAAAQHAMDATGQSGTYRPDQEDAVASRVELLLGDGLTAEEAGQVCLLNNPAFQAAWMDVGMARADLVQSGLLSNPSLGGSLRLPAAGGLANLEVTIAQNIADLWQIPVRKRRAQASLDEAIFSLARRAAELAADTRGVYFRTLGARQLQGVAEENLIISRQLLELAVGRQQAGAGSELDVNLSRSAVLEAELAVESARLAAADARRSLARQLGLSSNPEELILSGSVPDSPPVSLDAETLIAYARQKRLDLRAAQQAVAQTRARVREEWLKVFPTVGVGLAMERAQRKRQPGRDLLADTARQSIADGGLSAPEIQPRSDRRRNTDIIIGPSWGLALPIFDQNQAQIAKANYASQQAAKTLESIDRLLTQEVRGAVDRMATNWRMAGSYRSRFVPLAQRNLELSRESYKAGRASFLSVLEAQRFHLDARRRFIEAMQAAAGTIPELERVVGVPIRELQGEDAGHPATRPASSQPITGDQP